MSENDIKKLIENLNGDEESRKKAVFELGEKKAVKAVTPLLKLFKNETVQPIRRRIVTALGKIKSEEAISPLCEALFDSDFYVRQIAARSLGKIGDKRAVEPLLRLIKDGGAKVYTSSGADHKVDESESKIEEVQIEGIAHLEVQTNAIKALGAIGDKKSVGALIREFDDVEGSVRSAIAIALGNIGSVEAVPALMAKLDDSMWYIRREAAISLGKIGDKRATDALIETLNDKYQETAEASANALEKLGDIAIAKAFLMKPKNTYIQQLVKKNFKTKKDIVNAILKAVELEEDPIKREKLQASIKQITNK